MINVMCSVFDYASNTFGNCFMDTSEDTAKRGFAIACKDSSSMFAQCPDDFSLFVVGSFDTETGTLIPIEPTRRICNATDFIKRGE